MSAGNRYLISLVAIVASVLTIGPAVAKMVQKPLKIIAPDLVIETAEQGAFYTRNEKTNSADPRSFAQLNTIPQKHHFFFGWRIKVKTSRRSILVQERTVDGTGKQGVPARLTPQYGYIFRATDYVETFPAGRYKYVIYVENQPVTTFSYKVQ